MLFDAYKVVKDQSIVYEVSVREVLSDKFGRIFRTLSCVFDPCEAFSQEYSRILKLSEINLIRRSIVFCEKVRQKDREWSMILRTHPPGVWSAIDLHLAR